MTTNHYEFLGRLRKYQEVLRVIANHCEFFRNSLALSGIVCRPTDRSSGRPSGQRGILTRPSGAAYTREALWKVLLGNHTREYTREHIKENTSEMLGCTMVLLGLYSDITRITRISLGLCRIMLGFDKDFN